MTTHQPYRAWCRYCVAAAARRKQNLRHDEPTHDFLTHPMVGVDYCFIGGDGDDGLTVLVSRDFGTGMLWADVVPRKGVTPYAMQLLVGHVLQLGWTKLAFRHDGEHSINSFIQGVIKELKDKGVVSFSDVTPVGESNANGVIESSIRLVKERTRALWLYALELHGVNPNLEHEMAPWVVRYSAQVRNLSAVGADGCTPLARATGRRAFTKQLVPWGSKVLYASGTRKEKSQMGAKWLPGIFVGFTDRTTEYVIATPDGCIRTNDIKRLEPREEADGLFFNAVQGSPWKLAAPGAAAVPEQVVEELPTRAWIRVETQGAPEPIETRSSGPRRVYIRKSVEILKYGQTPGCAGCEHVPGEPARSHTEACRKRIEAEMAKDPDLVGRITQADDRQSKRRVDEPRPAAGGPASGSGTQRKRDAEEEDDDMVAERERYRHGREIFEEIEVRARIRGEHVRQEDYYDAASGRWDHESMKGKLAAQDAEEVARKRSEPDSGKEPRETAERGAGDEEQDEGMVADSLLSEVTAGTPQVDSWRQVVDARLVMALDVEAQRLGAAKFMVSEIFSPARFAPHLSRFGLVPGVAVDLRTGWDLNDEAQVAMLWEHLRHERPALVIGSPECKGFSSLRGLNTGKPGHEVHRREGMKHLEMMCEVYRYQIEGRRWFVHEHPWGADSWSLPCVEALLQDARVECVMCDQCMFGQWAQDADGTWSLARKRTGFMTNCAGIAREVEKKCDEGHQHVRLLGGLAAQAARYPLRLVLAILRGFVWELRATGNLDALGCGPTVEEANLAESQDPDVEDEITGVMLDGTAVRRAKLEEIAYMHKLKIYEGATVEEAKENGCVPIPTRWVHTNKGDETDVQIRSRIVIQETRRRAMLDPATTFASTPPLESVKILMSMAMSGEQELPLKLRRVLGFYDISRAHFHSPVRRKVYIVPPPEDESITTGCARLLRAAYGLRDAGQCFEIFCEEVMGKLGFQVGVVHPSVYYNCEKHAACVRHGDDFIVLATRECQRWFQDSLSKHMLVKLLGVLGPCANLGDKDELRVLNRIVRFTRPSFGGEGAIEWEPDPRHVEILARQLGLEGKVKTLTAPGRKPPATGVEGAPLSEEMRTIYRSATMRYAYLAQDRADLQFSAKELARSMQNPCHHDWENLKKAVRYVLGARRLVQRFTRQPAISEVKIFSDSDHAGCLKTRKSTSSTYAFLGDHLVRSSSTTQQVVSLSSGESEFYAAVKGASVGIGLKALLEELGVEIKKPVRLILDATAGIGMASRRGAGRIRHIHAPSLWLQRAVSDQRVCLEKVRGELNPADLGTKYLEGAAIKKYLALCGYVLLQGISKLALKAALSSFTQDAWWCTADLMGGSPAVGGARGLVECTGATGSRLSDQKISSIRFWSRQY